MKNFMEFNIKKVFDYRTIKFGVCHLKTSFGQFELISLHKKSFFFFEDAVKTGSFQKIPLEHYLSFIIGNNGI